MLLGDDFGDEYLNFLIFIALLTEAATGAVL